MKNSFSRGLYAKFFSWLDSESLILFNLLFSVKVERVTKKMTEDKKEYDLKMQEYAQLLDIRADRIRVSTTILLTFQFVLWQMFLLLLADRTFTPWVSFSGSYFLFVWPLSVCVFVCLSISLPVWLLLSIYPFVFHGHLVSQRQSVSQSRCLVSIVCTWYACAL